MKKNRVIVYVDGFNLYFGMVQSGFTGLKWLNLVNLARSFLKDNQELAEVKYFTSPITNDPPKEKRQRTYLSALRHTGVKIITGKYQQREVVCNGCSLKWFRVNEKMTDVNIATEMILDAVEDKFDVAILISGDSDLVPAIKIIAEKFYPKYVAVFFPPNRQNVSVKSVAAASFQLGRKKLKDCQLPDEIMLANGYVLKRPSEWV
jgi:hypothetical protein